MVAFAASMAGLVLIMRPFGETAAAGFNSALEATRLESWIHATTIVEHLGISTESQSWCSPQHRIAAFQSPNSLHFVSYEEGVQSSYSNQADSIYRWRANMGFENFGRSFVQALLANGNTSSAFPFHNVSKVKRSHVTIGGRPLIEYSLSFEFKGEPSVQWKTTVETDPQSGRIVSWEEHHAGGMHIETTFDYPSSGPTDIYSLGVDRNTKVIDRVASSDVLELEQRFQQQIVAFGDYQAIVVDQIVAVDPMQSSHPLVRRLVRKGKHFRVELLTPKNEHWTLPSDADCEWWQSNFDQFDVVTLADCQDAICTTYSVIDSRLELGGSAFPAVGKSSLLPVMTIETKDGGSSVPIWPQIWPEYACRPLLMTSEKEFRFDIDPSGSNGPKETIRLRLLTPDSSLSDERASYWLSINLNHCIVKSAVVEPALDDFGMRPIEKRLIREFSQFQESPNGVMFANRILTTDSESAKQKLTTYFVDFEP
jgi:hypothetical protein